MKLNWPAISLSLLGHSALVLLLLLFARPHTLPDVPKAMQAVLMSAPTTPVLAPPSLAGLPAVAELTPPAPEPMPAIEPKPEPKPTPVTTPKKAITPVTKPDPKPQPVKKTDVEKPKPDPAVEAKRLADEVARVANAAQAKAEAELKRQQQEALAEQMQAEVDALANSAANAALAKQQASQLREFTLAINKKIKGQWRRPPQVSGQLATLLRITVIPGGEVNSVIVTKSSGNPAFDASVKDAVLRASPLPVPADAVLFRDNFRVFALNYTTEE